MEKKIQRPIRTDYGVSDDEFLRTMSQLLGPPLVEGNKVTALHNGEHIFPAMLDAIRSAQRTITFENFVYWEGCTTCEFADALIERAETGVKVHFLQDAFGCSDVRCSSMQRLRKSKVELEIFRFARLTQLNQRTHRKLLVVDGKVGFIGGVGIADAWDGDGKHRKNWRDSHYRVEGPAVAQIQQAFTDNWMQTRATVLHGDAYFPEIEPAGDHVCQAFKSSIGEGADSARVMLLLSIAAARRTIRIANAYFIPDDLTIRMLVEACRRGVAVEIITPCELIDQKLVRLVGRSRWGPLLEAGARFYEYQPAMFHCKYMLVDDCWASVGSANFDDRSLRLNEEANLNVRDAGFAKEHTRVFDEDKRRSKEITLAEWRHRSWKEKISGSAASILRSQL